MGARAPSVPFERAEFVRADQNYSILNRIVKATQVDTILHTFMITNSATVPRRAMHEINVIGTMNLLAAAGAAGSSVRHIVVKSSTLVYGSAASDPNTFHEDTPRTSPVKNSVERALVEAEGLVRDFSEDNPAHQGHRPALRQRPRRRISPRRSAATSRGPCARPSSASTRSCSSSRRTTSCAPSCTSPGAASPASTTWPATGGSPGARWPASAGPGWSPSRPTARLKIRPLARLFDLPAELEDLLRYGRGVDTRRLRRHRLHLQRHQRRRGADASSGRCGCAGSRAGTPTSYTYEHDVEQFFRHSPSVVGARRRLSAQSSSHSVDQARLAHAPIPRR